MTDSELEHMRLIYIGIVLPAAILAALVIVLLLLVWLVGPSVELS